MKLKVVVLYAVFGILFGTLFPLTAGLWLIYQGGFPFTLNGFLAILLNNPLMWMIDTAPLFLGLFALMGGIRQSRVLQLNEELNAHIIEQPGRQRQRDRVVGTYRWFYIWIDHGLLF